MRWVRYSAKLAVFLVFMGAAMGKSEEHEQPPHDEGAASATAKGDTSSIPLASILTTSPQEGMLQAREVFRGQSKNRKNVVTSRYLEKILQGTKGGASNVFLVDATNVSDAVKASSRVIVGSRSANTSAPVNTPNPIRGNYWLVAYLGSGPSSPTWWTVEKVGRSGSQVRVTYRRSQPSAATSDVHEYYYWVPLGALDLGIHELELYDAERKVVSLMRRVEVSAE